MGKEWFNVFWKALQKEAFLALILLYSGLSTYFATQREYILCVLFALLAGLSVIGRALIKTDHACNPKHTKKDVT